MKMSHSVEIGWRKQVCRSSGESPKLEIRFRVAWSENGPKPDISGTTLAPFQLHHSDPKQVHSKRPSDIYFKT